MRCLIAAAFLIPALLSQPANAAAEKSSGQPAPIVSQDEAVAEAPARPAVDIKLRIRSRWADLSVRINFG